MDKCHYCFEIIENLNDEYKILSNNNNTLIKDIKISNKLYKKFMYNNCLKYISDIKNLLDDIYNEFINNRDDFSSDSNIDDFIVNSKNILNFIKRQSKQDLVIGFDY
jgi:hypothetical protein